MMVQIRGLVPRKTGKNSITYYCRHTVTKSERAKGCPKKEIWVSLSTADPDEAIVRLPAAKAEAKKIARSLGHEPSAIRLTATAAPGFPAAVDLQELTQSLTDAHYLATTTKEHVTRSKLSKAAKNDPAAFWGGKIASLPKTEGMLRILEDEQFQLHDALVYCAYRRVFERISYLQACHEDGNLDVVEEALAELLRDGGVTTLSESQRVELARAILHSEVDALTHMLAKDETKVIRLTRELSEKSRKPTDNSKVANGGVTVRPDSVGSSLLSEVAIGWIAEKSSESWSAKRTASCRATLALFSEVVGDKPIADYTKSDVRNFKEVLRHLPPNKTKNPHTRHLSARAGAAKAQELGLPSMSTTNQNQQLRTMQSLFRWVIAHYDHVTTNPFTDTTIANKTNAREQRASFSIAELIAIFAAPVFRGCSSETHWKEPGNRVLRDSAKFWVPVLGLLTE